MRNKAPLLLDFARHYPEIELDLVTEDRPIDIVAEGFDAGVRPSDAVPKDMIALYLEPEQRFSVVGAPACLDGRELPQVPQDLLEHRCIRARLPSGAIERWEFVHGGDRLRLDVPRLITLDEAGLMLEAALAGAGLAYLADWWADKAVAEGQLHRLLADYIPPVAGLSLYYPSRRHQSAALLALTRFIRTEGRRDRAC